MMHVLFFALKEDITTGAGNLGAAHTSTNGINNAGIRSAHGPALHATTRSRR
jgi:hypothetical protein